MYKYTAQHLSIMSTILTCATRTQSWKTLGLNVNSKQEEIQIARMGNHLFIGCNNEEHQYVEDFLTAWGVRNEATFIDALKWSHCIMVSSQHEARDWKQTDKKSGYSSPEKDTLDRFSFPPGIPKKPSAEDLESIKKRVGKEGDENKNDWQAGPMLQLLGCYRNNSRYHKPTGGAISVANFKSKKITSKFEACDITVINNSRSKVHAELKILGYLARVITKQEITNSRMNRKIHLGGLKIACAKCNPWLMNCIEWLFKSKHINLHLPLNDGRVPFGSPINWAIPETTPDVISSEGVKTYMKDKFVGS